MRLLRIHFITGKVHEMRLQQNDAETIAAQFNVDPNGTNRINGPDGTLIVNRNHITHVQILPEPIAPF